MPGVRVTSVRRTVRIAVALVTGQALLCGIIGFVTFGGKDETPPRVRAAEPQLAGPPLVVPGTSPPPSPSERPERSRSATTKQTRTERPTSPTAPASVRSTATRSVSPSRTVTPPPPVPPPTATTSPTDRALLPPSSPVSGDDPLIPVADEPCDERGATGRTADGKAVRCERDRDGDLRWRLV